MNTTCSTSLMDLVRLLAGIASARAMLAGNADAAAAVPKYFKNSRRSVLMRIHTSPDCSLGNREPQVSLAVLRFRDDSVFISRLCGGSLDLFALVLLTRMQDSRVVFCYFVAGYPQAYSTKTKRAMHTKGTVREQNVQSHHHG